LCKKALNGISNDIVIDKKLYRITLPGLIEAKRIINKIAENLKSTEVE